MTLGKSPTPDARRIFVGIADTYDWVGAVLSFGQDPRWRAALVASVPAGPRDLVLDVASGTGMVAAALARRRGCRVVGLDQSASMLGAARQRAGGIALVRAGAEALPFADGTFDHLTFTYLLRYVEDPRAQMAELARVVKPGGTVATLEFAVPGNPIALALWRLYTRLVMPIAGAIVSSEWRAVCAFLGPSIEGFYRRHPQAEVERYWREAGLESLRVRPMSLGGGVVMSAKKAIESPAPSRLGAAFYARPPGGIGDYWTLLHPPYTLWHLSYVLLGAALGPAPDMRIVAGALLAFGLATGVSAHALDELKGRPLGTSIPSRTLAVLAAIGLAGAAALGIVAASMLGAPFLAVVALGVALVLAYGFEIPLVHSDVGFALAWGAFPVLTGAVASGAHPLPALAVAGAAALISLVQRRLSTVVRRIRRTAIAVRGTITYRDGARETLDARWLIAAPEDALRVMWIALVLLGAGALLARWLVL